ncbi:hypothetical protein GVN24_16095 [Rhizobium sp. CRIBSB]|nr:hypothetical protein [Rhizobium sp. CRIBSB]
MMGIWLLIWSLSGIGFAAFYFTILRKRTSKESAPVPEHVWLELKASISEADYNYLRATSAYMGGNPADLISRLNYVGSINDPKDPKQVRISILELRLAELDALSKVTLAKIPSDGHIVWLSISSVSTVSSLVALVFYLLQKGYLN